METLVNKIICLLQTLKCTSVSSSLQATGVSPAILLDNILVYHADIAQALHNELGRSLVPSISESTNDNGTYLEVLLAGSLQFFENFGKVWFGMQISHLLFADYFPSVGLCGDLQST